MADYDINHPTTPEELLMTLQYYRDPMHLQSFQKDRLRAYLREFGSVPQEYVEPIKALINKDS
ncbi:hypothetical protein IK110_01860 [Candidatus Saccharibacteria bacterium]|nr:hypothetical protein [Candidatus Saccharibacteria bacterium]